MPYLRSRRASATQITVQPAWETMVYMTYRANSDVSSRRTGTTKTGKLETKNEIQGTENSKHTSRESRTRNGILNLGMENGNWKRELETGIRNRQLRNRD